MAKAKKVKNKETAEKTVNTKPRGMKWFHFLIYFLLWFNAFGFVASGVLQLSGYGYELLGTSAKEIYAAFPLMEKIDLIYGVSLIVLALHCLITRSRLAKFKKRAPGWLYTYYFLDVLLSYAYMIGNQLAMNIGITEILIASASDLIGITIGFVIALVINKTYFKKRKHLFVN